MNENVEVKTDIIQDQEINIQDKVDSTSENKEVKDNVPNATVNSSADLQNYTIVIDGKESNYLVETYKEMKITNMYLLIIIMSIVLIFVLNKLYYYFKNIFTIKI